MKIKKIVHLLFTFLGILAFILIAFCIVDSVHANIADLNKGFYPEVFTYIDQNGNGIHDKDEPPLSEVCFDNMNEIFPVSKKIRPITCDDDSWMITGSDGIWTGDHPSSKRRCKESYIVVVPPEGYRSTNTPADNLCNPEFGFTDDETLKVRKFPSIGQYAFFDYLINLSLRVLVLLFVIIVPITVTWWLNKS